MDLSKYEIIRRPVVSSKASVILKKHKQVVLFVHPEANKQEVAKAIEQLFDVKVDKVRIIVRKGKMRTFKRIQSRRPLQKKAIVTLKQGYSFDKLGQIDPTQMPAVSSTDVSAQESK